jgi:hypothetical protein
MTRYKDGRGGGGEGDKWEFLKAHWTFEIDRNKL